MSTGEDGTELEAIEPTQEDPQQNKSKKVTIMTINKGKYLFGKELPLSPFRWWISRKLFSNVQPIICQRKSSSSSEKSLNLRLLKII